MNPDPSITTTLASDPSNVAGIAAGAPDAPDTPDTSTLGRRIGRELLSWLWVALAFFLITGTMVQARVIPSGSMENTLLVGDHLLMSRFGYDATLPFTRFHMRLWREPHRQQVIIFRAPLPGSDEDFIKRLIAVPGDTVEIRNGVVFVNGHSLSEPYRNGPPSAFDNYGRVTVPAHSFFVLGDNRDDSYDSRYWGFVPENNILGTPVVIYMSVEASEDAWQPGQVRERFHAYLSALVHPGLVRWRRLFKTF